MNTMTRAVFFYYLNSEQKRTILFKLNTYIKIVQMKRKAQVKER